MKQLLSFTDNMPLAVDLLAHLVYFEGLSSVLTRWELEKTSLLSDGHDRRSNLDVSIVVSLSSPRITTGAKELLSLLSILPDGLSDIELIQSNLPIQDVLSSKSILLATSLAYQNDKKRLKSLVPIREHILQSSPPSQSLLQPFGKHFHTLLELYRRNHGVQLAAVVDQITPNLGNLQQVLHLGLHADNPDLADTIYCAVSLNAFYRATGRSRTTIMLMSYVPPIFPKPSDRRLETSFITEVLLSHLGKPIATAEVLISRAISHFQHFHDLILEGERHSQFVQLFNLLSY
jgi:hypothetical protein